MSRRPLLFSLIGIVLLAAGLFGGNLYAGNTPSLGLDLQGGASVTMTPKGTYDADALTVAVDIIRQRVDSIGVSEPEIIRQGDTVVVNLPGVKDQQQALELVGRTGAVEMRPVIRMADNPNNTTTTVAGSTTTTIAGADKTSTTLAQPTGGLGSARHIAAETTTTTIPTDPVTGLEEGQTVLPGRKDGFIYLLGPAEATGEVFSNDSAAEVSNGAWVVVAQLKSGAAGEDQWNALAGKCYAGGADCPTKQIAIILDGEVISAPVVQQAVFTGGTVQISGSFTEAEARDLAKILEFGAVPVKFSVATVQTVSPTLGKDSLRAAVISGLVGVLLVMLFFFFYYRLLTIVVISGLAISGSLLWSVISYLSKTNGLALTLSGVAGIVVSIGVTVDSYVVFFERLKDELVSGKTMRGAAQRSFTSAWRTILAADTVSFIGAIILWQLTVGSVRGFAFFLGLSTLIDVFVAYLFTRPAILLLARSKFMAGRNVLGVVVPKEVTI